MVALGLALPAFSQDSMTVEELQRVIESQQKQIEAQQQQLDIQRQLLEELQNQMKTLADPDFTEESVADESSPEPSVSQPETTTSGVSETSSETVIKTTTIASAPSGEDKEAGQRAWLSDRDRYDQESPTGSNVTYIDPNIVLNVPGTNTSIGLHGLVEAQVFHDTNGQNNNRFDTVSIPVDGAPSETKFSVNPTQIFLSSNTPLSDGDINTMISMDFNGELDKADPRLRIAMAEFVSDEMGLGLLAGQAYTTMLDLRAVPETFDFAGPAGLWQTRQPMIRVTRAFRSNLTGEFALETPENVIYIDAETETRWPDFAVAGTWRMGNSNLEHFRLAGLLRDLNAEGTTGSSDSTLGWAVTASGKLGLPSLGANDNFKLTLHYGEGYGTQVKGGPRDAAFDTANSELESIGIFGGYGGIQHFWSSKWRSNLVYGFIDTRNPSFVSGDTLDNTEYAAIDLAWTPYESATLSFEYLWGRRENQSGDSGTSNRYLFTSKVSF